MPIEPRDPAPPFLPAERTQASALLEEVARAAASPLVTAVLDAAGSAAALLDLNRQVIALNAAYLAAAGVDDPEGLLGLRPGEALGCRQLHGEEGCGTTAACPTCGAALAMMSALADGEPASRRCALGVDRAGVKVDLEFEARACPVEIDGQHLLLLTLRDVSREARRALVERTFLHDLSNLATGLQSAAEELGTEGAYDAGEDIRQLSELLVQQVRLQRLLASGERAALTRVAKKAVELCDVLTSVRAAMHHHPAALGRSVEWPRVVTGLLVWADPALLHHVVASMVENALEAVPQGTRVRLEVVAEEARVRIRVSNPGTIPAAVVPRIFQRYFTTRPEPGRGHGTWAMKYFGEELLGGTVTFDTSETLGTSFDFSLPRAPPPPKLEPPW